MAPKATLAQIKRGEPGVFTDAAGRKWTAENVSSYTKPGARQKFQQSAADIEASAATRRQRELLKDESALGKLSLDYERGLVTKKAIDSPEFSAELAKKMGEQMAVMTKKVTDDINIKLSDDINKAINETTKILTTTANGLSQDIVDAANTANKVMRESAGKIKDFASLQDAVDANLKRTLDNISKLDASTAEVKKTLDSVNKLDSAVLTAQKTAKLRETQTNNQFDLLKKSVDGVASSAETMQKSIKESTANIEKGFIPAVNGLNQLIVSLMDTTDNFSQAVDRLTNKMTQSPPTARQTTQALETQALAQAAAQSALPPSAATT